MDVLDVNTITVMSYKIETLIAVLLVIGGVLLMAGALCDSPGAMIVGVLFAAVSFLTYIYAPREEIIQKTVQFTDNQVMVETMKNYEVEESEVRDVYYVTEK